MKMTMKSFVSRVALVGVAASAALLAGCGKQEADNASAPASTESMPTNDSASHQESMQDMPMPNASPSEASDAATATQTHVAKGTIKSVDPEAGTVKIAHEAVPSLNWPAMTMDFRVADKQDLAGLTQGEELEFHFIEESAGRYAITEISPQR